jgi:hypothetical protein
MPLATNPIVMKWMNTTSLNMKMTNVILIMNTLMNHVMDVMGAMGETDETDETDETENPVKMANLVQKGVMDITEKRDTLVQQVPQGNKDLPVQLGNRVRLVRLVQQGNRDLPVQRAQLGNKDLQAQLVNRVLSVRLVQLVLQGNKDLQAQLVNRVQLVLQGNKDLPVTQAQQGNRVLPDQPGHYRKHLFTHIQLLHN